MSYALLTKCSQWHILSLSFHISTRFRAFSVRVFLAGADFKFKTSPRWSIVMSHYDKIPALLNELITCSVAEAARRVGIRERTVWRYLVRSKMGDEKLQEIEFCGVVAPFHTQMSNCRALAAEQIQQNAIERARDGVLVDVFFQGQRQYERVLKEQYQGWSDQDFLDMNVGDERFEMIPTKQWLKPSDQLVIKMLESWHKKYRSTSDVNVTLGGVLRMPRPDEPVKTIDATPAAFEDVDDTEQRGGQLALGRPARDSAELDRWNAAGEFNPTPVGFVDAAGVRTELVASPDPLLPREGDSPLVKDLKARAAVPPANPYPLDRFGNRAMPTVRGTHPDDAVPDDRPVAKPAYAKPVAGGGVMGRGKGPDPHLVGGARGFKQS
jgi:hypothetical protein